MLEIVWKQNHLLSEAHSSAAWLQKAAALGEDLGFPQTLNGARVEKAILWEMQVTGMHLVLPLHLLCGDRYSSHIRG